MAAMTEMSNMKATTDQAQLTSMQAQMMMQQMIQQMQQPSPPPRRRDDAGTDQHGAGRIAASGACTYGRDGYSRNSDDESVAHTGRNVPYRLKRQGVYKHGRSNGGNADPC